MKSRTRLPMVLAALLACSGVQSAVAWADPSVDAVEVRQAGSIVRYEIHTGEEATFSVYTLRTPYRLFVDVANVELGEAVSPDAVIDAGVLDVRVTDERDARTRAVRFVFFLAEGVQYDVQADGEYVTVVLDGTYAAPTRGPVASTASAEPDDLPAITSDSSRSEEAVSAALEREIERLRFELASSREDARTLAERQREIDRLAQQRAALATALAEREHHIAELQERTTALASRLSAEDAAESELLAMRAELEAARVRAAEAEALAEAEFLASRELQQVREELLRRDEELVTLRRMVDEAEVATRSAAHAAELTEQLDAVTASNQAASEQIAVERRRLNEAEASAADRVSTQFGRASARETRGLALGLVAEVVSRRTSESFTPPPPTGPPGTGAEALRRASGLPSATGVPRTGAPTTGGVDGPASTSQDAITAATPSPVAPHGPDAGAPSRGVPDLTDAMLEVPTPSPPRTSPSPALPVHVVEPSEASPNDESDEPQGSERVEDRTRPPSTQPRQRCRAVAVDPVTGVRTMRTIPCPR